ncbi:MAG: AraC family transcriptional regulator [Pseudomonadota bacterium]
MEKPAASTLRVNHKTLHCRSKSNGQWYERSLPIDAKQARFLSAQLCDDIFCTVSTCHFEEDYYSCIEYDKPTTLLIFGIKGVSDFSFSSNDSACTVRPGDVWLFSAGNNTLLRKTPALTRSKMIVVKYDTQRLKKAFYRTDTYNFDFVIGSMMRLGIEQSPDDWVEEIVKNKLLSVSDRLMAEAKALELIAQWIAPASPITESDSLSMQKVIAVLTDNLATPPTLEKLAKHVGMSHTKLNRQFKKTYGLTVFDWLRQYRLKRAKKYLNDPKQAITSIAHNCGFSSASHFTQVFKSHFGETPSEYRTKHD